MSYGLYYQITTEIINNFLRGLCSGEVEDNGNSVHCHLCHKWNYTGCSNTGTKKYKKLKNDPLPWYYPNHAMEIPFLTLHNKDLTIGFFGGSSKTI